MGIFQEYIIKILEDKINQNITAEEIIAEYDT